MLRKLELEKDNLDQTNLESELLNELEQQQKIELQDAKVILPKMW